MQMQTRGEVKVKAKAQRGFTLIELMIVIAIVAILAAAALPAYQDYTVRARMSEPLAVLAQAKTSMSEFFVTTGALPGTAAEAGIETNVGTDIVDTIAVDEDGNLILTLTDDASLGDAAEGTIMLRLVDSAAGTLQYACQPGVDNGVPQRLLPPTCRN